MSSSLPGTPSETGRKGALNTPENPSRPLVEDEQLVLGAADDRCRLGASRMAALAHDAQRENGFSLSTLSRLIGKDDAVAASRAFDSENPHTVLRLLAALVLLDKTRTWLRGLCRLAGGEFVDQPRLTDAEFRARVERKARRGRADSAWLDEALEEP